MQKIFIVFGTVLLLAAGCNNNTAITPSTPSTYGTNPLSDQAAATPATAEQKEQCAKDGAAWFQTNVTDEATPQAIYKLNASLGTNNPSLLAQQIYPGNPQYVFSTKLDTCLVDWAQTISYMDGTTFTSHSISDVYTNKNVAEWDWTQKPGQNLKDALKSGDNTSYETAEYNLIQQQK